MQSTTLTQLLHKRRNSGDVGITFIEKSDQEDFLSYGELYGKALHALAFLQSKGMQPGDELVFQIEDNKTFIIVFWAGILGGIVPVPLSIGQNDDHRQKLFNIWAILNNPYLIASGDKLGKLGAFAGLNGLTGSYTGIEARCIDEDSLFSVPGPGRLHEAGAGDLAFIQFSSGSTGNPKGVVLTHKNLLTNMEAISRAARYSPDDSMISWMPLTHDMGLIGFHLNPLLSGMHQYLMPTGLFIRRPAIWLDKASEHRVSILCSPNFGYKYLLKHCAAAGAYDWDLSGVRLLYNGAEPISEKLCRTFLNGLARYGLKNHSMCPVYGLAEASLAVSISGLEDEVITFDADRRKLNFGDKIAGPARGDGAVTFVNVGKAIDDCAVRIADHANLAVGNEIIGHVQIKGSNVTVGYYNNAEATRSVMSPDGWLDTGDLGFVKDGSLYITGRAKDIIFVNGQNYYPHDIERVAEEVEGVELNKIAVAGHFNDQYQQDETIAFVFHRGSLAEFVPVARALRALLNGKIGFEMDRVIPVKDIPRTTSGKLQRFRLLEQFKNGDFNEVERLLNGLMAQSPAGAPAAGPENEAEQQMLRLWTRVLNNTAIGVNQKFFEIGGNSLKAAELGMALQKEFGAALPPALLYEKQTVRELAGALGTLRKQAYVPLPVAPPEEYAPLAPAQRNLYYAWEAHKTSTAYNTPVAFRIKGQVNANRLENCIRVLAGRHDALRTTFRMASEPQCKVNAEVLFALGSLDCTEGELNETLRGLVQPFDLAAAPLFRASLLKLRGNDQVLFVDFHHIIADGISIRNFVEELLRLYAGSDLPVLPAGYRDYVYWEKANRQSPGWQAQETYWLDHLRGVLPVLEMPLDFARPAVAGTEGEKLEFSLGPDATAQLRALARANGCTLHALLFTVYNVLLWKYTGQEDLIVGIPVAGRAHPDLQHVQGMFVNNLAVRSTLNGEESFTALLLRQKENLSRALDHQAYPFGALVEKISRTRDVSRNPVFDSMFSYQNMGLPAVADASLSLSRHFFDPGFAKFDLSLEVFEEEESLKYGVEYASGLFRRETIVRLAKHFNHLIRGIIANPDATLARLPLITAGEYTEYVSTFNATGADYAAGKTIDQLFEEQVRRTPGHAALEYNGTTISYEQLNRRADQLAALLREKGIAADRIAGVLLPRSPELVISILGILKAGGSYLPIDTDLPDDRIRYIVSDSRCEVLITNSRFAPGAAAPAGGSANPAVAVINLDRHPLPPLPAGAPAAARTHTPRSLAYVIYTSGTTGRPKGVMIEHRSLVNYVTWAARHYVQGEKATFPLYTSVSFDLTVTSIFTPLLTGNKIVVYGDDANHLLIEKVIADDKADVIKLTPSHLTLLLQSAGPAGGGNVKRLVVGGEKLDARLARQVCDKLGGNVRIYNEYGPTEATVGCMIYRFDPREQLASVPVGFPAANTRIYVLDAFLNPVPPGVNGEMYIAGDGLARGYLFNEELTAQKFIADPFAPGQKMYKTGDVARRLPGGAIEYIGRRDQQVKINGYRIELSEIESHLLGHPQVREAVAVVGLNQKGQPTLGAYYTSDTPGGESPAAPALRSYLAGRLPHYMIPVHFTRLPGIPLTNNGKVDYSALPAPQTGRGTEENRPPRNRIEALSLKIWEEVLGEKDLRVTDNFLELGGDSIKAVQITSRLFNEGISVDVKTILTYQTVAQVSLRAETADAARACEQGIVGGEKGLTPIESWFFSRNFANPGYYNQSVLLTLHKKADKQLLEAAFAKLIEHHDGLRLNYNPAQHVLFYNNAHLEAHFAVGYYPAPAAGTPPHWPFTELKAGFDLAGSLLIRAAILEGAGAPDALFITAHHLVVDGLSWRILLEDLCNAYLALEKGEAVQLPRKTVPLSEWERKLNEYARAEGVKAEESYWNDIERTDFALPQDAQTDDWRYENLRKVSRVLDPEKTRALLKESGQAYRVDALTLLNTALALSLRQWTGRDEFLVEQENHGRHLDSADASRTLGWFTAMYPVKLELPRGSVSDQIKSIKEQIRQVPRRGIGYGICKYPGTPPGRGAGAPTPLRFNYLGRFDKELDNEVFSFSDQPTGGESDPGNVMTTKLEMNAMIIGEKLILEIGYNQKAHQASTINWFTDVFFNNLEHILRYLEGENDIHFTPSDFESVRLDQEELDALF